MSFSYFMLQMSPYLLLFLTVFLFGITGAIGTWLFRKFLRLKYKRSHNEVVGYIFAILGGFYGLLLGFVVFLVWDSLDQAQSYASREGSLARGLYRDIRYYPDQSKMKDLKAAYIKYVHTVIDDEYPDMEKLKPLSSHNRKAFNQVFIECEKLDPHDPQVEQMFRHLNELSTDRGLRQLSATSEIPLEVWVPLLLGGAIILVFAMGIDVESLRLHMTVNALLGGFIGMVIYLIIILDHPYTGSMKIQPDEYKTILRMEQEGD